MSAVNRLNFHLKFLSEWKKSQTCVSVTAPTSGHIWKWQSLQRRRSWVSDDPTTYSSFTQETAVHELFHPSHLLSFDSLNSFGKQVVIHWACKSDNISSAWGRWQRNAVSWIRTASSCFYKCVWTWVCWQHNMKVVQQLFKRPEWKIFSLHAQTFMAFSEEGALIIHVWLKRPCYQLSRPRSHEKLWLNFTIKFKLWVILS